MRQGTSKAVPVVVSAGLAVGVFCGLLFGLGTGGDDATAGTKTEAPKKDPGTETETPDVLMAKPPDPGGASGTTVGSGSAAAVAAGAGSGSAAAVAAGAGSGSAAGSAAGSAEPAIKTTKLIIEIKPEAAAQVAKITVDGKDTPPISDFELGDAPKKKVIVIVKAEGFKDQSYEGDVEGDETKFSLEMQKKPSRPTGSGLPRPVTGGGKKPSGGGKKPGGGLIDI